MTKKLVCEIKLIDELSGTPLEGSKEVIDKLKIILDKMISELDVE